jgi:hypothetical protein
MLPYLKVRVVEDPTRIKMEPERLPLILTSSVRERLADKRDYDISKPVSVNFPSSCHLEVDRILLGGQMPCMFERRTS